MNEKIAVFWFRRDLRLEDNSGLSHALNSGHKVLPIFIFDTEILHQLDDKYDKRVDYIHQNLALIQEKLKQNGFSLRTFYGKPLEIFKELSETYKITSVFCNRDYEPKTIKRDDEIRKFLKTQNIEFQAYKDQVIFEKNEILKDDGTPYTVFTPYSKKWKSKLKSIEIQEFKINYTNFLNLDFKEIHSLDAIGFHQTDLKFELPELDDSLIKNYDKTRDFPALHGTTELGIALRFGTISIRKCVKKALELNETWLNELIWREFFIQILYHFPKVVTLCFKAQYEKIPWRNNEKEFELWCKGKTGYPIVDAGMHQINQTGQMHNRLRMITASFLTKHLLIDWRWGEAYFAQKLLDYDLAANNGNWQWAAGCGCDAAPYFRIFNPTEQTKKFDKDLKYIKKWNPDFESRIITPIVEHKFARERALKAYKTALKET